MNNSPQCMERQAAARRDFGYWLACICLALSMALVGSYVALARPLVAAVPVFLLAWLRFAIGAAAMLPWLRKPADEAPLTPGIHGWLFLESLFGNFLFSIFMLYGVRLSSAASAGLILAATPAAVALLGWLFLREQPGRTGWLAVALACLGVALTQWPGAGAASCADCGASPRGGSLLLAAVLCEASYAVIGRRLTRALRPHRISALINLWGLALMTPPGLAQAWRFDFGALDAGLWGLLLFYALAASVGTVWLWMTGLRRVPAASSGVFTVFMPLTAALVGVLALGERLQAWQVAAFVPTLLGVVLAAREGHRRAPSCPRGKSD